jgi:hypothetical protein
LEKDDMEAIITGIASGMVAEQKNEDIKLTALKALQDARQLLEEKFSDQNVREFILGLIVGCSTHKNEDIALKAVQCLIDFVKSFYEYLAIRHMDVFSQNIVGLMKKNNMSLIIAGTEFWNSLAYHEQKLFHRQKFNPNVVFSNFINVYASGITQVLLENLITKGNEDTDSGCPCTRPPSSASRTSTSSAPRTTRRSTSSSSKVRIVVRTQASSAHQQDDNKVAALLCFEAMIYGYTENISHLIVSSFSNILAILKVNEVLCKAALQVLKAVADRYPEIMLKDENCVQWLDLITKLLSSDIALAKLSAEIITGMSSDSSPVTAENNYGSAQIGGLLRVQEGVAVPDAHRDQLRPFRCLQPPAGHRVLHLYQRHHPEPDQHRQARQHHRAWPTSAS